MAYKIAASMALREAAKKCKPVILEPIMLVEVTAPTEYMGSVMGDISSRRGQINDQEERGNAVMVKAYVCLLYTSTLRLVGNQSTSANAEGCLTARPTSRAGTKVGISDPAVPNGRAVAQRIKATLGITG